MKDVIKLIPNLVSASLKKDNNSFESILITIIRFLSQSEEYKGTSKKLSDILSKHQAGTLNESKFTRNYRGRSLENNYDTGFFKIINTNSTLDELYFDNKTKKNINEIISSYKNKELLNKHNLEYIKKVIITGKPGTGKTSIGKTIASELDLNLHYINISTLFSSYLGDSAKNINSLFNELELLEGVFLFDEFDSIAISRNSSNEVGEIRRIVNSVLTYLENWEGNGIIICTSNETEALDEAIWRRFDMHLHLNLPDKNLRFKLLKEYLGELVTKNQIDAISELTEGYSPAEIELLSQNNLRSHLLNNTDLFLEILNYLNLSDLDSNQKKKFIKKIRENYKGTTYRELANIFNVSKSTVARYVNEE